MRSIHAIDTVLFNNKSASLTVVTPSPGDTNVVRSFATQYQAHLIATWLSTKFSASAVAALIAEIKSSQLHDNAHGIHIESPVIAALANMNPNPFVHTNPPCQLFTQDNLEIDLQGDGIVQDAIVLQILYDALTGTAGNFITQTDLIARGKEIAGVPVQMATTNGNGQWEGAQPINSIYQTLKPNIEYAFLGANAYESTNANPPVVVSLKGTDSGSLRLGVPCSPGNPEFSNRYWVNLDKKFGVQPNGTTPGKGMIPVFNAANQNGIFAEVAGCDGAKTYRATFYFQELTA